MLLRFTNVLKCGFLTYQALFQLNVFHQQSINLLVNVGAKDQLG
jgi:hypothetical protein